MEWIKLSEQMPPENKEVLISDGTTLSIAHWFDAEYVFWNSDAFSGYEWDWDFTPTHWAEIDFKLPKED